MRKNAFDMLSTTELSRCGFFSLLDQISELYRHMDSKGIRSEDDESLTSDPNNEQEMFRLMRKAARMFLLDVESSLSDRECELYLKPRFGPDYKPFDLEHVFEGWYK